MNYRNSLSNSKVMLYTTATSNTSNWTSGAGMTVGTTYTYEGMTCVSTMNEMTQPVILFGLNNIGTPDPSLGICLIGGWTAYNNGVKVMELIPVRKDGVGYMYDKVSGELFGNDGTGIFGIGPDKNS